VRAYYDDAQSCVPKITYRNYLSPFFSYIFTSALFVTTIRSTQTTPIIVYMLVRIQSEVINKSRTMAFLRGVLKSSRTRRPTVTSSYRWRLTKIIAVGIPNGRRSDAPTQTRFGRDSVLYGVWRFQNNVKTYFQITSALPC